MTNKLTDDELLAIVDGEIADSVGQSDSKLSADRLKALQYYNGEKVGALAPPESEGRSQIVSKEVADTIEWIMPSLMEIFTAGDEVVKFEPQGPEDEEGAEQSTDYVNYVFYRQNPGFIVLHNFIKDALMQRLGVTKIWWNDAKDVTEEDYEGLDELELMKLATDPQVEIVEQTPVVPELDATTMLTPPQPTFNVKVKRTRDVSKVTVEGVPPEEFLFSKKARSGDNIYSCHHRVRRTISQLRAMGYKNLDELSGDDSEAEFSEEAVERRERTDSFTMGSANNSLDETMRMVWITESYLQVDYNGDGIAEWRKVVKSGKVLLENEEIDDHPFALITPILMPHELVGVSVSDLVMDLQEIKTALTRQIIDNMFLQNNPRLYVDETQKVNIDDLLDSRVGGIVRGKGPNGVSPIVTQGLNPATFSLLEYIDSIKENRTGVTRYNQGMDANSLNKTATGVNAIMNAAQMRTKLIARVLAETGIKDLFKKILKLSAQHQKKAQVIRLRNKWIEVDPRAWANQYDIVVNVGLGTGNKDQMAAHLMNIMAVQKEAMTGGLSIVDEKALFNTASKLVQNMGFKNPEEFFVDPEKAPPKQPQPDPKMIEAQQKAQLDGQKFKLDVAKFEFDKQKFAVETAQNTGEQIKPEPQAEAPRASSPSAVIQVNADGAVDAIMGEHQAMQQVQTQALLEAIGALQQAVVSMDQRNNAPRKIEYIKDLNNRISGAVTTVMQ